MYVRGRAPPPPVAVRRLAPVAGAERAPWDPPLRCTAVFGHEECSSLFSISRSILDFYPNRVYDVPGSDKKRGEAVGFVDLRCSRRAICDA